MYTHKTTWFRPYKPSPGHERAQERAEQERLAREVRSSGSGGDDRKDAAELHAGTAVSKERAETLSAAVAAAHRTNTASKGGGVGEMLSLKEMLAEGSNNSTTTTDAHTNGGDDVSLVEMLRSDRMADGANLGSEVCGGGGTGGGGFAVQPLRSNTMRGGAVSLNSLNGSSMRKQSGRRSSGLGLCSVLTHSESFHHRRLHHAARGFSVRSC